MRVSFCYQHPQKGVRMTHGSVRTGHFVAAAILFLVLALSASPAAGQSNQGTTFSGRATVIQGTLAGIALGGVADTGPLEPGGGARENSLVCYPDGPNCQVGLPDMTNGALSAKVLHASTVGRGEHSRSNASVAEFSLSVGGVAIQVELIQAIAEAACQAGAAAVSGASKFVNLLINDLPVVVTGEPSQDVSIGPVTIVLNEQTPGGSGNAGEITVNALHIMIAEVRDPVTGAITVPRTDLIIAQAHADIRCGQRSCNFAEKVTGGGFVLTPGGDRMNFAVAGRNLSDWGHFLAINHGTGDKMKATALTTSFDADGFAVVRGTAQVNGAGTHQFTVRVKDEGEPGANDRFELTSTHLSLNVPLTTLGGGNIQFHKPCGGQ